MSGELDGRIAIITGGGQGIGREHALLFASEGAKVVVNDIGAELDGSPGNKNASQEVADEIMALGGEAVASSDDVSKMQGAKAVFDLAQETFGGLDVVVNNAGVLRDKMIFSMAEDDWDLVMNGHLRTTFCMTSVCARWWREESKAERQPNASIINTSSTSGLIGQIGQSNYGAAKAGIAAFSVICAKELVRYGIRVNAIAPTARTRMTMQVPGLSERVAEPEDAAEFDVYHPRHPAVLAGWLAAGDCETTGRVFYVNGGDLRWWTPWARNDLFSGEEFLEISDVRKIMQKLPDLEIEQ